MAAEFTCVSEAALLELFGWKQWFSGRLPWRPSFFGPSLHVGSERVGLGVCSVTLPSPLGFCFPLETPPFHCFLKGPVFRLLGPQLHPINVVKERVMNDDSLERLFYPQLSHVDEELANPPCVQNPAALAGSQPHKSHAPGGRGRGADSLGVAPLAGVEAPVTVKCMLTVQSMPGTPCSFW